MKIEFWVVGKTQFQYLNEGIAIYEKRMKKYLPFQTIILPDIKNAKKLTHELIKEKEGKMILDKLEQGDLLILLDEKGETFTSEKFAAWLNQKLQHSARKIIFLVGGAYGFSEAVYQRAHQKIALSSMTFSHQMVRLFFIEQFYRALTILKNEPYHHS
ncbi:MAG TPA: 23S rRNA (pseudouridine(1915)-N(3))-methyltransferase RlmH [Phaeodactylibacter sp.]|nr:23S rRNA (pseudouridine(1915)-N(3))-methyltransferase RlmH [Phaeodactylibacter sp.]